MAVADSGKLKEDPHAHQAKQRDGEGYIARENGAKRIHILGHIDLLNDPRIAAEGGHRLFGGRCKEIKHQPAGKQEYRVADHALVAAAKDSAEHHGKHDHVQQRLQKAPQNTDPGVPVL